MLKACLSNASDLRIVRDGTQAFLRPVIDEFDPAQTPNGFHTFEFDFDPVHQPHSWPEQWEDVTQSKPTPLMKICWENNNCRLKLSDEKKEEKHAFKEKVKTKSMAKVGGTLKKKVGSRTKGKGGISVDTEDKKDVTLKKVVEANGSTQADTDGLVPVSSPVMNPSANSVDPTSAATNLTTPKTASPAVSVSSGHDYLPFVGNDCSPKCFGTCGNLLAGNAHPLPSQEGIAGWRRISCMSSSLLPIPDLFQIGHTLIALTTCH